MCFRFLFWPAYVFYHPDHVKRVLQENYRNYTKNFPNMQVARRVIGNGLFANEGDSWLHQRRLMQPSFHHNKLVGFGRLMTDSTTAMLERWQRTASDDVPLDIPLEMMRLTLRVAGLALFSLDLSHDPSPSLKGVLARDPIGPYEVRGGARRHVGTGLVPVWAPIHAIHPVKHHTSSG